MGSFNIVFVRVLVLHDRLFNARTRLYIDFELIGSELRGATKFYCDALYDKLLCEDEIFFSAQLQKQILRQIRVSYTFEYTLFV